MTGSDVHACPRCDLRFELLAELRDHLSHDHPPAAPAPDLAAPASGTPPGTILVPVDPTHASTPAIPVASTLARQTGFRLELVAAPLPGFNAWTTTAFLRSQAAAATAIGATDVTTHVLAGAGPAGGILEHIGAWRPSFVCMATHSRGALAELVLGSVSEAVLRQSTVPVLLIGPHVRGAEPGYQELLVCVDGSDVSKRAMGVIARLGDQLSMNLFLVEVLTEPVPGDVFETVELSRVADSLPRPPAGYDALHGRDPARAIIDFAARRPGTILAMGTHGRSGVRRLTAGSVALDVIRRAPCPVLVVPPGAGLLDDREPVGSARALG